MAARQPVAKRGSTEVQAEKAREEEFALAPPVDIFEDANGITVQAEMPGVSKDRLNVHADRNSLIIEGDAAIDMPAGMEALYADVRATTVAPVTAGRGPLLGLHHCVTPYQRAGRSM